MKTELICDNKNCIECYDGNLLHYLDVDKLIVKKTTGQSGAIHPDVIKKETEIEEKQKVMYDKLKKMSDDIQNGIIEFKKEFDRLYDKSNKLDFDSSNFEKQYPFCKRIWRGDESPHMKIKSYTFDMEQIESDLNDFMKKFYQ